MKESICKAFCNEIKIREVPVGIAVSTAFLNTQGDPIGFYIIGPDDNGHYKIEDDGLTLLRLETDGADIELAARAEIFLNLLEEYGFTYDEEESTLASKDIEESQVPSLALSFVALLLRIQDLVFLVREKAESTFKEEAMRMIREKIGDRADILEREIINEKLSDFPADVIFRSPNQDPVALFFGTSDQNILSAILLEFAAHYKENVPCKVVTLIEDEKKISRRVLHQAANYLDALPIFVVEKDAAISRVVKEVLNENQTVH